MRIESHRGWQIDLSQETEDRAPTEEGEEGQRPQLTHDQLTLESLTSLMSWVRSEQIKATLSELGLQGHWVLTHASANSLQGHLNPNLYWVLVQNKSLRKLCPRRLLLFFLTKILWDSSSFACRGSILQNKTSASLPLPTNTSKLSIICIFSHQDIIHLMV